MSSITATFGADTAPLRSAGDEAKGIVGGFSTDAQSKIEALGGRIEHHIFGIRALATAIGTALGLHIQEIAEKFADLMGFGKEVQKQWDEAAKLSDQTLQLQLENQRKMLTEEQRYQQALDARQKLSEKQAELSEKIAFYSELEQKYSVAGIGAEAERKKIAELTVELRRAELEAAKNEGEIIVHNNAQRKEEAKAMKDSKQALIERNKLNEQYQSRTLDTTTRITLLTQEIADGEALIAGSKRIGADTTALEAQVKERRKLLADAEAKAEQERVATLKKGALALDEEIELFELERKKVHGLSDAEQARYNLLKLQSAEKRVHLEIEELEQKLIDGTITPAEKNRLHELIGQDGKLKDQIAAQKDLIAGADAQAAAESRVTDELKKQAAAKQHQATIDALETQNAGLVIDTQILAAIPRPEDMAGMSTAALQGLVARATAQKNAVMSDTNANTLNAATVASGFYGQTAQVSMFQSVINAVQAEMDRRASVESYITRYGESAARTQYGDALVNSAMQDLSKQNAAHLQTIAKGLTMLNARLGV